MVEVVREDWPRDASNSVRTDRKDGLRVGFVDVSQVDSQPTAFLVEGYQVLDLGRGRCPYVLDGAVFFYHVEVAARCVALPDEDAEVAKGENVAVTERKLLDARKVSTGGQLLSIYFDVLYLSC